MRVVNATKWSLLGLQSAYTTESAFRDEILLCCVAVPVALLIAHSFLELLFLIGSLVMVLIVELLNTGIEAIVDLASPDKHHLAGKAKDVGSAAVFLSLGLSFFTWVVVIFG